MYSKQQKYYCTSSARQRQRQRQQRPTTTTTTKTTEATALVDWSSQSVSNVSRKEKKCVFRRNVNVATARPPRYIMYKFKHRIMYIYVRLVPCYLCGITLNACSALLPSFLRAFLVSISSFLAAAAASSLIFNFYFKFTIHFFCASFHAVLISFFMIWTVEHDGNNASPVDLNAIKTWIPFLSFRRR